MTDLQSKHVVAAFAASREMVDLLRWIQDISDAHEFVWCHFADAKNGLVNVAEYFTEHRPEVVILDIAPPYLENWRFAQALCAAQAMTGRSLVLVTTNKVQLDAVLGHDSHTIDIGGTPDVMHRVVTALEDALTPSSTTDHRRGPHAIH